MKPSGPSGTAIRRLIIAIAAVLGFCVVPIVIAWFSLFRGVSLLQGLTEGREASLCQKRLAKVAQAVLAYAADHDDTLPPADGWVDATWKYAGKKDPANESESVYRCPALSKRRTGEFGYAYSEPLGAKPKSSLGNLASTPLAFDSSLEGRNAHGGVETAPHPPRHRNGTENYAANADGTVVRLRP